MTSEKHFFKYMKENMSHKLWLLLLSLFLYMGFAVAFATQMPILSIYTDMSYGPGNSSLMWLTALTAVLCAFQSFSYLFHKKQTDFYASLPLKKKTLFAVNYINGFLVFLLPFLLSFAICTFAERSLNGTDINQIAVYGGWEVLMTAAGFLFIYSLSILVIMITGTFFTAVPVLLAACFYSQVLADSILIPYFKIFYKTFYRSELLESAKEYLSPILLYSQMAGVESGLDIKTDPFVLQTPHLLFLIASTAVFFLAAWLLYKRRPAEACQKACVFKYTEKILSWLLVIPSGLLMGLLLMKAVGGKFSVIFCVAGIAIASFVLHELLEGLFRFHFQKPFRKKLLLTAQICLGLAVFMTIMWSQKYYDTYLPKEDDIAKIGISVNEIDVNSAYSGLGNYINDTTNERLSSCVLSGSLKSEAYRWISRQPELMGKDNYTSDTVAFYMKDGRTIYRNYSISSDVLSQFDPLYRTKEYKAGIYELMDASSPRDKNFYWSNGAETLKLALDDTERAELLKLSQDELADLSIETLKTELPAGTLTLKNDRSSQRVFIYPSFQKTMQFLNERNIPVYKKMGDYDISSITVKNYKKQGPNYYGENRQSLIFQKTTDNQEVIGRIKPFLIFERYANQPLLNPVNTGCEVTAEIRTGGMQSSVEISCYALKDIISELK